MIIKTKKLSAKEVKKKFHDFVDELADGCGPELEQDAESLKKHGAEFVERLSGESAAKYRDGGSYRDGNMGYRDNAYMRDGNGGSQYRDGMPQSAQYRNDGTWQEREEHRKRNERKMQELERDLQDLKMRMRDNW